LAENAQVWETTNTIERAKPRPSSKGGLYHLKKEDDVNSQIAKLTRKVKAIELGKIESKAPTSFESSYGICETNSHLTKDFPIIPAFQEVLHEQANVANAYRRPFSSPYSENYNSNWQNHPNFSWRNGLPLMNPKDLLHMHPMSHHIRRALRIHCRSLYKAKLRSTKL
jgi:hypothetical protein